MRSTVHESSPARTRARLELGAVLALSVVNLIGLGLAGRLPAVDLPQHALVLSRALALDGSLYTLSHFTPYTLYYGIAALLGQWLDPVEAVRWTAALSISLPAVAAAALAHTLGRSPLLGCLTWLGVYGITTAWGLVAMLLGLGVAVAAMVAGVRYTRSPTAARGALLCLLVVLSYTAHLLSWVLTLSVLWAWLLLCFVPRRPVALWPLLLATLSTLVGFAVWWAGRGTPYLASVVARNAAGEGLGALPRLLSLPHSASAFGTRGALLPAWLTLAGLALSLIALGLRDATRRRARARALAVSTVGGGARGALPRLGRRYLFGAVCGTAATLYLFGPTWLAGVFFVSQRFLAVAAATLPACLPRASAPAARPLRWALLVAALWLQASAWAEVARNDLRTACMAPIAAGLREGEQLLALVPQPRPEGYAAPVDAHLGAELAALRRGQVGMDFIDFGAAPVAYRRGIDRMVVPPLLGFGDGAYDHARHGGEFTAFLLVGTMPDIAGVWRAIAGARAVTRSDCGRMHLLVDRTHPPGTLAARRYLPHPHPDGGGCGPQAHPTQ